MSRTHSTPDGPLNLATERTRLTRLARAQADELEMKNAQMRGDLVTVEAVHLMVASGIERVRVKMLAGLSGVVPMVVAAHTPAEVEAMLTDALRGALDELAAVEAEFADDGPQAA